MQQIYCLLVYNGFADSNSKVSFHLNSIMVSREFQFWALSNDPVGSTELIQFPKIIHGSSPESVSVNNNSDCVISV